MTCHTIAILSDYPLKGMSDRLNQAYLNNTEIR